MTTCIEVIRENGQGTIRYIKIWKRSHKKENK